MSLPSASAAPLDGANARPRAATVLLGVALYLTARTFVAPGIPVLLGGDQAFAWMYAERLLRGQHVYKDFFQFTPPGADVVYAALFSAFGPTMATVNATVVLLGVLLAAVAFAVARTLMPRPRAALATALYTVLVFGHPLDATHHYWSVLFVMASVAALAPASTPGRLFVSGALAGAASFFTETHGAFAFVALVGFALWETREERRPLRAPATRVFLLVLGAAASLALLWGYFVVTSGLGAIVSSTLVYPWRYMRAPLGLGLALPEPLTTTSVRWLFPYLIVYAVAFVAYPLAWRGRHRLAGRARRGMTLVTFVGAALLVGVLPSPSWVRIFAVSMPAFLLLVQVAGEVRLFRVVAWGATCVFACVFVRSTYRHHDATASLPAGRVATTAANGEKLTWLSAHAAPGTTLFAAFRASLYLQLRVTNPLYLDAVITGTQLSHEQAVQLITSLDALRPPVVVWPEHLGAQFPGEQGADMDALREYLHAHYRLARTFADGDQVWDRR